MKLKLFANVNEVLWSEFRATFTLGKFKVALNPLQRLFTLQRVISSANLTRQNVQFGSPNRLVRTRYLPVPSQSRNELLPSVSKRSRTSVSTMKQAALLSVVFLFCF